MVEIEFNVLRTKFLDQRIPDAATFRAEVAVWAYSK